MNIESINYNIIGITGRKYNGKDTLGKLFVDEYGFKQLAYADPLKDVCKIIFGFTDEQLYGSKKEELDNFWKITPRTALQFVGTNLFREQSIKLLPYIDKNIWVEVMKKKILDEWEKNPSTKFVITDIRFQNEAQLVKDFNGIVIRVTRNIMNTNIDNHASEAMIDNLDVDYDVTNNESIEKMYLNVKKCIFK